METNQKIDNEIVQLKRKIRSIALLGLLITIMAILSIDIFVLPNIGEIKRLAFLKIIVENMKTIALSSIPVLFIAVFIAPITEHLTKIKHLYESTGRLNDIESSLLPLENRLKELPMVLTQIKQHPEIYKFISSYQDVDWFSLLSKSREAVISFFYSSTEWNRKNIPAIEEFLSNNGKLTLLLPDTTVLKSKFTDSMLVNRNTENKIFRTIHIFRRINMQGKGELNIGLAKSGMTYALARIKYDNYSRFLLSPYQNNWDAAQSPALIIDEHNADSTLKNFIEKEIALLYDAEIIPDFERNKYLIWDEQNDRVFVSLNKGCQGGCPFCYVEYNNCLPDLHIPQKLGLLLSKMITTDNRFKPGIKGTSILLGGFTDPFLYANFDNAIDFINNIAVFKNLVHISTRYGFGKNLKSAKQLKGNIIINYSFNSPYDPGLEIDNVNRRFDEIEQLINEGVNVALYIRPVIPEVTLSQMDRLIERAKIIHIKLVTIGGLYIDKNIKFRLKDKGVFLDNLSYTEKKLIVDPRDDLKKIRSEDTKKVAECFKKNGFMTFSSSLEIVKHIQSNGFYNS